MQRAEGAPIELFYSYSHEDEEYREKLGKYLSVLRRAGLITDWHDRDIDAGRDWQEEIDRHLLSADIVLLLVSASFIAPDYCWGDEMTKALTRHKENKARVIPIILHPCPWPRAQLRVLQGVPRDKAISLWANEHAAFDNVVNEISKVVDDLRLSRTTGQEYAEPANAAAFGSSITSWPRPASQAFAGASALSNRTYLDVPYEEKDEAKSLGARWDAHQKKWYVPAGTGLNTFKSWLGPSLSGRDSPRGRGSVRPLRNDGVHIGVDPSEMPDFTIFRDVRSQWCPEMVVIPPGQFLMGSPLDDSMRRNNEGPQHRVTIRRFAIGRYAVTFAEYDHFCEVTGRQKPGDHGWGRGRRPVINVSWRDAAAYLEWFSEHTGQSYRLLSEAEWEYACRAGSETAFCFGERMTSSSQVIYDRQSTLEVGSLPANRWGLHEMHGNVWEWIEDVWHDSYAHAPVDGSAWTEEEGSRSNSRRVVRGGCFNSRSWECRSAYRDKVRPGGCSIYLGFRVARTL